ncbi:hypothetical protein C1H76_3323 [Elsinoe australis]|uniref:Uncharacterized protein n=1 Tax=Elsinoe australis TaxID=40998 RepID=A0A4U7B0X4_9PEZI|nr:hypothetical protein C1H76_3323 [Elsinoe australis]
MSTSRYQRSSLDDGAPSTFSGRSRRSSGSDRSDNSYHSQSTVPTEYEYITSKFDSLRTDDPYQPSTYHSHFTPVTYHDSPRSSVETYASTVPSLNENPHQDDDQLDYEVPTFQPDAYYDDTIPTTPADFSKLFPSTRKLNISHDDSTPDGNMNLKTTTQVRTPRGRLQNMTLFHLRMYDLKSREFSLRRYDRDSGREVCHSSRNYQKPADKRPGFQRSLTNAIASLRTKSDNRMPTLSTMNRAPVGREDSHSSFKKSFESDALERPQSAGHDVRSHPHLPTNTTRLEFSNYAKVEVKRRGTKSSKRYEFEYWGKTYQWKRAVQKTGKDISTSYYLFEAGTNEVLAKIIPEPLSPTQQQEERSKGGWVPPCAMWISDERLIRMQNDVSDVIIATGLVALVDDCIKRRFHGKPQRSQAISLPKTKSHLDESSSTPRRALHTYSQPATRNPTPLRYANYD